jgi:hypothetical protein
MAARAALGIGAVSPSLSYTFGHGHGPTWLQSVRATPAAMVGGLSSGLYTTGVPPPAGLYFAGFLVICPEPVAAENFDANRCATTRSTMVVFNDGGRAVALLAPAARAE